MNQLPVANDDEDVSVQQDQQISIAVLNNDNDPDGDPLTVTVTRTPLNGTVAIDDNGVVLYIPNSDFLGSDSFVYQIDDGRGGVASATVTIDVTGTSVEKIVVQRDEGSDGIETGLNGYGSGSSGWLSLFPLFLMVIYRNFYRRSS